jgi:mycothione reductase
VETYDIAIIGTGSGNSILDHRYRDKRIAICEERLWGGTCLNVGCIPTKMFVYAAEVAQTVRGAARYGIDAHVDRVRWDDIVSRVFSRIDPIGITTGAPRRTWTSTTSTPGSDRCSRTDAICCAPKTARNSPRTRW